MVVGSTGSDWGSVSAPRECRCSAKDGETGHVSCVLLSEMLFQSPCGLSAAQAGGKGEFFFRLRLHRCPQLRLDVVAALLG